MSETEHKRSTVNSPLRNYAAAGQRWASHAFTGENIVSVLKTLAWVIPLTILIWVYAEREQVIPKAVTIPIAVRSADPTRLVRLGIGDQSISATLVGPNAAVQQAADLVQRAGDEPTVQIEIDRSLKPGLLHTVDVATYLSNHQIFKSRGVTVRDCNPRSLQVFVDDLAEREVTVRAPASVTNLAGPPVFEPRTVKVRGTRTALDESRQTLTVEADFANREELRTPGSHELAAVPLRVNTTDPSVTIVPNVVRANIDVSQSDARLTIGSMPVWLAAPPGPPSMLEKYKVDYNPVLTNITLVGPSDKIDLLKNRPELQRALLYVTRADIGKPESERPVTLPDLPEGVSVTKEDEPKLHVRFKLIELTASE